MKAKIMKQGIKVYAIAIFAFAFLASCNDDFVNITPLSEVSEESVWVDEGLAIAAVTGVYNGLGVGGFDEQMMSSLSDEATFTHTGRGINTVNESRTNSNDAGWVNYTHNWNDMYRYIRAANIAIQKLGEGGLENTQLRDRLLGEAHFLRAYYYHQLVRFYGGVALTKEPFTMDSEFNIPRSTLEESISFIVEDCETAFSLLDGKNIESGRATAATALALKSRILLYAASDLYDRPTASGNSSLLAGFSNPELISYTSGSQQERWTNAKNAAKAAMDYFNTGYKFGLTGPVSLEEGEQNYLNISLARNGGETDIIFERQFVEAAGRSIGLYNGPNGYHNWAGNTPIQNLVDSYAMSDGSKFDWNNPAHSSNPYADREPRFYASILYDGADWKPRPSDVADRDPANQIQTGQYQVYNSEGSITTHFGLDTRQSTVEDWNGSRTGYYFKKFTEPDPAHVDQNTAQTIPWPFFRYTELVLNYVEAVLEADGDEAEAKNWLDQIRFRVGLPAVTETGADLMEVYRNERKLELTFEEHRYHDVRRWMIAPEILGAPAGIIQITGTLKPGVQVTRYQYDTDNYDYSYVRGVLDPGFENRLWLDKSYFTPIRDNEIKSNTTLVQNPGYE